ncbi:MAG TPA: hypothetical protein VK154_17415 [Chitinophagales bacterium]|nr:hypothetical protein [Chitinophagales bacterium]
MSRISLLKRKEIDTHKWDALIDSSITSLPYAYSWYLDAVAEDWEALVLDDYRAVFPLPFVRKLGFKCLYQPYYCQQLGVFSSDETDATVLNLFFEELHQFPYININLNPSAKIVAGDFLFKKKKNLLLPLDKDYSALRKNFSENHRRNIAKAEKAGLIFLRDVELDHFQQFYLQNINRKKENFKVEHEGIFKAVSSIVKRPGKGQIFGVYNTSLRELTTAALVIFHQNRAINIINTSSTEGKKNGSAHFLFNSLIQEGSLTSQSLILNHDYSNGLILDFEGSSVPGIARFYQGFGAQEEIFYNYHTSFVKKLSHRFRKS